MQRPLTWAGDSPVTCRGHDAQSRALSVPLGRWEIYASGSKNKTLFGGLHGWQEKGNGTFFPFGDDYRATE